MNKGKMKKWLLPLLCLWTGSLLQAQEYKKKSEGYFNLTQISFLLGEVNENAPTPVKSNIAPSVAMINGYRVNEHFSIGVGVGATILSYTIFPVFADFRITLFKDNVSPVLAFKGGYSFANSNKDIWGYSTDNKNSGGAMLNPEVGVKVKMADNADFVLTIGYWYQHLQSEMKGSGYYYYDRTRTADINRLSFSIGFLFK